MEAEASGQEVESGGRSDPCVFVLECESMSVSMTQPLKHTPLNWNQSELCVCECKGLCTGNLSVFVILFIIYNSFRSCSVILLARNVLYWHQILAISVIQLQEKMSGSACQKSDIVKHACSCL